MTLRKGTSETKACIITGPTSGVGRATALVMAKEGTLVLVGRNLNKLRDEQNAIEKVGGQAVPIVCDMSDLRSVHRALTRYFRSISSSSARSTTLVSKIRA